MTELELLDACLAREDELDTTSYVAFLEWKKLLEEKKFVSLTAKRRSWLDTVCTKLGIDPGSANLVSSGTVKPSEAERKNLAEFHASLGPKVLKPPGRRGVA